MIIQKIKDNSAILTILIIAIIVRIWYLVEYSQIIEWDILTVDNYYHLNWAVNILEGNTWGDTTYFRAPFYIYCLALIFKVFGVSILAGRIFGLICGLASIILTYKITKMVFTRQAALIAACLQTFYPVIIYYESELLLDNLFTLLLQLVILSFMKWTGTNNNKTIFTLGVFLGLAAITRPTALILIPIIIGFIIYKISDKKNIVRQSLLFIVGTSLLITPIFIRNVIVADDPVLISSQGGVNFYIGNNETADGLSAVMPEPLGFNWRISQITKIAEEKTGQKLTPGEVSSFWYRESLNWISRNPAQFIKLYFKKLYFNFTDRETSNNRNLTLFFDKISLLKYNPLSFGLLFALTIFGLYKSVKANIRIKFLLLLIVIYSLSISLFFINSRFRLPLLPIYIIVSSFTLSFLTEQILHNLKKIILPILIIMFVGLLSYYPIINYPNIRNVIPILSKGLYFASIKKNDIALKYFHQARTIDSTYHDVNTNIGLCYFKMGVEDSAVYYFEQEKSYNPEIINSYINLASIYLLNDEYEKAISELEFPLENKPDDLIANQIKLRAMNLSYDYSIDQFMEYINQAALNTYDNIYLLNEAGILLSQRNYYDYSETILFKAILSKPPPFETDDLAFNSYFPNSISNWERQKGKTYQHLGFLKGVNGDYQKSIEFCNIAIKIDSSLSQAYINLISAYYHINDSDNANQILNLAILKFPDNEYLKRFEILRKK